MDKEKGLRILGFALLAIWILTFFEEAPYFGSFNFLWFCKISFLLLAIACLSKDASSIVVFLAIGAIPQIIWTIDFFSVALGHPWIGSTSFMFEYGESPFRFLMNLPHLLLLPCAFFILSKKEVKKDTKKIILLSGGAVIIASYLLSGVNVDINCVHNFCYPKPLNLDRMATATVCLYIGICAFFFEPILRRNIPKISKRKMKSISLILLLIAAVGISMAAVKYMNSPHYTCESNKQVRCERFFMDREMWQPYIQFSLKSTPNANCTIDWMVDGRLLVKYPVSAMENGHATLYLPNFQTGKREITSKLSCPYQ